MNDKRPIGIFDSGVGGLSILRDVKKLLPKENFIYLADQANNPYGGRSIADIKRLSSRIVAFLEKKDVKLIIVACNTVSVNAIDSLRLKFKIPIIAVVPVVKTIAEKSKTKKAAVFSTPATAKSKYLKDLIRRFAGGTKIYTVGTSRLEHLVEKGIIDGDKVKKAIKNSLLPLIEKNVDSVALGCTHYPFLTPEIKRIVGNRVAIYDSGGAIARRVQYILSKENILSSGKIKDYYYTTGDALILKRIAEKLLGVRLEHVEHAGI